MPFSIRLLRHFPCPTLHGTEREIVLTFGQEPVQLYSWILRTLYLFPTLCSPAGEAYKEARKFRRILVDLPCLFSADGPHEWSGTAVNLSREGCAIRSTTPVQKGQYLRVLLFPSANQTPIEVGVAPVRWVANGQFGVEFITLTSRDATRLQGLLTIIGA